MAGVSDIAAGAARYLGKELKLSAQDTDMVRFGIEIFLDYIVSIGVLVGVAWELGILPYVLAAWFTINGLRSVSGGAHASTLFRCTIIGTAILVGIGELAFRLGRLVAPSLLLYLVFFSAAVGLFAIFKWAPADTPAKPIVSIVRRAHLRKLSYIYIVVWVVVMSILITTGQSPMVLALIVASIGGFLRQIFSISPAGYQFIAAVEVLFDKYLIPFWTRKQSF